MLQGVLFDMDGVLFDTEALYTNTAQDVLRERGHAVPANFMERTCGANHTLYKASMLDMFGKDFDFDAVNDECHLRMNKILGETGIPKKPGLDELLAYLKQNNYKIAVASSTRYTTICSQLKAAGIDGYFTAVIGGDMVQNSKPDPEIFCKAATALGLDPRDCLALEDSANGVRSAAAAGCVTVMVPDLLPATEELRGLTAAVLPSLAEVPAFLETL